MTAISSIPFWSISDPDSGRIIAVFRIDEVESIHVPNINALGVTVNFRSGKTIDFPFLDGSSLAKGFLEVIKAKVK